MYEITEEGIRRRELLDDRAEHPELLAGEEVWFKAAREGAVLSALDDNGQPMSVNDIWFWWAHPYGSWSEENIREEVGSLLKRGLIRRA